MRFNYFFVCICSLFFFLSCIQPESDESHNGPSGLPEVPPVLLTPKDSATNLDTAITLTWSHLKAPGFENHTYYDVLIVKISDSTIFSEDYYEIHDTSVSVTGLEYGQSYYWDVVALWYKNKYGTYLHQVNSTQRFIFSTKEHN
jgi:hypothetical protein